MVLVGLTGGIGSGKSTVADLLRKKGATVVDADVVARAIVEPGQPALAALVRRFGDGILLTDGRLDRPGLARIAFADEESRQALNGITWPGDRRRVLGADRRCTRRRDRRVRRPAPRRWRARRPSGSFAAVIVVEAPPEVRLARLEERGIARDDAERRMAAQASDDDRREYATYVLDNSGDVDALARQVDDVWADLERLQAEVDGK